MDSAAEVIRSVAGPIFTTPIRDALMDLPAVDLAVAYGVAERAGEQDVAVAAVTLRPGHELTPRELGRALAGLESDHRPAVIHVVQEIPVTTWFKPLTAPLRQAGIPNPERSGEPAWFLDAGGQSYRPLTPTAYRRLVGRGGQRDQSTSESATERTLSQ